MFFSVFNGFNIIMSKIKIIIILMYFQAKFTLKNILHHNTKHVSHVNVKNKYGNHRIGIIEYLVS
jgi:hypothetical protein